MDLVISFTSTLKETLLLVGIVVASMAGAYSSNPEKSKDRYRHLRNESDYVYDS